MALKTKIGKADFDKLPDALKTEYIADGEGYKHDADYEDVTGLKANRDEVLKQLAEAKKAMKAYEGLGPEAARKALETANAAEDEKLKAAGAFEELKKGFDPFNTLGFSINLNPVIPAYEFNIKQLLDLIKILHITCI